MTGRTLRERAYSASRVVSHRIRGGGKPPVADGGGARSLFIGPANSAGQGFAWARAAERAGAGVVATSMTFVRGGYRFECDQSVPSEIAAHSRAWQQRQFRALCGYGAVMLESGKPLFSGLFGASPLEELRALAEAGVRTALIFHGSDIRDPDLHLRRERHTQYADLEFARVFREVSRRNRRLIADAGVEVFVSTTGLVVDLDEAGIAARWLPVVVDPERWVASEAPRLESGPLRVVHAPSSPRVKGTDLIEPVLEKLVAKGEIEYRRITGVSREQMVEAITGADVVLDQFRTGNYGTAVCEALAAGRVTIAHVSEHVRERTRRFTGDELPVVEGTPESLEQVLGDIRARPAHYAELAARGPAFVRRHHDGTRSGREIVEWMGRAAA